MYLYASDSIQVLHQRNTGIHQCTILLLRMQAMHQMHNHSNLLFIPLIHNLSQNSTKVYFSPLVCKFFPGIDQSTVLVLRMQPMHRTHNHSKSQFIPLMHNLSPKLTEAYFSLHHMITASHVSHSGAGIVPDIHRQGFQPPGLEI